MKNKESFEPTLYNEEDIENIEEEKDEIPWDAKIIFQRHSEDIKEPKKESYWRMDIVEENKQGLVDFLVDENVVDEEEAKKISQAKFIEDELINLVDNEKLDTPKFLDFLVKIKFAENSKEAKEIFEAYIDNNREFNELKKETNSGSLTEYGKKLTKQATTERLEEITKDDEKIDIIFLYSPTEHMDWRDEQGFLKGFGGRAKETTKEILNTISDEIKNKTELGDKIKENIRITGIGSQEKLRELNIFYIFDAPDPKAYINALREKFGQKDWWEDYYKIVEEFEDLRKDTGAEGPKDLAKRFKSMIEIVKLYDDKIKQDSERKSVFWIVSHMELMRSFIQYELKAKKDTENYTPDFNESLDINITPDNEVITEFKGKEYKIDL